MICPKWSHELTRFTTVVDRVHQEIYAGRRFGEAFADGQGRWAYINVYYPHVVESDAQKLLESQHEYGMFEHLRRYPWVLEPVLYEDQEALLRELEPNVIAPAEAKANEQMRKRP